MMDWLKRLLGGRTAPPAAQPPEAAPPENHPTTAETQRRLDAAWSAIGESDGDLLTYLVSPQFTGAPYWPTTRQAFRIVRTADSLIIASDGLTDPAHYQTEDDAFPGFGAEVYIELPGLQALPQDQIRDHWAFDLIESFARNVADLGGINSRLDRHGVLSMELPATDEPAEGWLTVSGDAGVLIGVEAPDRTDRVEMPLGQIRLIPITLLHQKELDFVAAGDAPERTRLAQALRDAGIGHLSVAPRDPVI